MSTAGARATYEGRPVTVEKVDFAGDCVVRLANGQLRAVEGKDLVWTKDAPQSSAPLDAAPPAAETPPAPDEPPAAASAP